MERVARLALHCDLDEEEEVEGRLGETLSFGEMKENMKRDTSRTEVRELKGVARDRVVKARRSSNKKDNDVPIEKSARFPVPRESLKGIRGVGAIKYRDPRFDAVSGEFSEGIWRKDYQFIEEIRDREIGELEKKLGEECDEVVKARIERALQVLTSQKQTLERKKLFDLVKEQHLKEQKERVAQGHAPVFMKKNEVKKKVISMEMERLKKSGGNHLRSYLKNRNKREMARTRANIPVRRQHRVGDE